MKIIETKNVFGKVFDRDVLGLPMTPAKWKGKFKYTPITIIRVSCGGGSQWKEYVERIDFDILQKELPYSLIKVTTIDGEDKLINNNNIVEVRHATMMEGLLDSYNFPTGVYKYRFLVKGKVAPDNTKYMDIGKYY